MTRRRAAAAARRIEDPLPESPPSGDDAPLTEREVAFADALIDRIIEEWQAEQDPQT